MQLQGHWGRRPAFLKLYAEQQGGHAGDDRGGEAAARQPRRPAPRHGPQDVEAGRQDSLSLVARAQLLNSSG